MICSIESCNKKHYAKDLCKNHYRQNSEIKYKYQKRTVEKICLVCEKSFIGMQRQKYCSDQCSQTYHRRKPKAISECEKYICVMCGKEGISKWMVHGQKYCSPICAKKRNSLYVERNSNGKIRIPSGTRGAISELKVAADLLEREYAVFRALSPSCPCDLAILKDRVLIRVEVTTGHYSLTDKLTYPSKDETKSDLLAVVVGNQVYYIPELP